MSLIKNIIKYSFAVWIGLLMVANWQWFWLEPGTAPYLIGILLLLFYGLFAVIPKAPRLRPFMLLIIVILFLMNNLAILLAMPELITSVDCNGKTYSIINYPQRLDWEVYKITTWNGMFDYHSSFVGDNGVYYSSKLTCDKNTHEIRLFRGNVLDRLYGTQIYTYEWQAGDEYKGIDLYSYEENDIKKYLVATCKPDLPETCQFLPLEYSSSTSSTEWASFIVDRKTGDIHILFVERKTGDIHILFDGDRGAIYTDLHNHSQKVKLITSFTPYIAPDQVYAGKGYGLLSYQTDGSFAYIFYRCDDLISDYPSDCDYIPFSYTTPNEQDADLNFDKTTDQLILSIGGKVVFTYDHPFDF